MRSTRFSLAVLTSLVAFGLVGLAACGSDDGGSSSGGGSGGDISGGLTGEPVEFMVMYSSPGGGLPGNSESLAGAEAAAAAINADGGLNGRPLDVIGCDTHNDSNEARNCARQAVDEGAVAFVGPFTVDDAWMSVAVDAGVAVLAPVPTGASMFTSGVSFPLQAGPAAVAGQATILASEGAERISVALADGFESAELAAPFLDMGIDNAGAERAGPNVLVPVGAVDVAPQVSEIADQDPDGVALTITNTEVGKILVAAEQANFDPTWAMSAALLTPDDLEEFGDRADGILVVSFYRPTTSDNPEVRRFVREMDEFRPDAIQTENSVNSWLGVQVLAHVAQSAPTIDAPTVLAGASQITDLDLGFLPPLTTTQPGEILPRLFNPFVFYNQIQDGEVVALSEKPVNPLQG